jgi:hypothetical protein
MLAALLVADSGLRREACSPHPRGRIGLAANQYRQIFAMERNVTGIACSHQPARTKTCAWSAPAGC